MYILIFLTVLHQQVSVIRVVCHSQGRTTALPLHLDHVFPSCFLFTLIIPKSPLNNYRIVYNKSVIRGVPVVAQWLMNPTRNHEVAGSIPALAQWVNDPVLP